MATWAMLHGKSLMLHMALLDIMLPTIDIAFHMQQLCKTELASTRANVGCCCERKFILPAGVGTPSAHPIEAAASSRRRSIPTSGIAADMEAEELQAHSATLAEFAAITGASSEVAAHYLEACSFNLERAVDFYFNNPPDAGGVAAHSPRPDAHADDEGFHVVEDDDPPAAHGAGRGAGNAWQPPARMQAAAAGPGHGQDDEDVDLTGLDEDEMLQRALAASLNQGGFVTRCTRGGQGGLLGYPAVMPGAATALFPSCTANARGLLEALHSAAQMPDAASMGMGKGMKGWA